MESRARKILNAAINISCANNTKISNSLSSINRLEENPPALNTDLQNEGCTNRETIIPYVVNRQEPFYNKEHLNQEQQSNSANTTHAVSNIAFNTNNNQNENICHEYTPAGLQHLSKNYEQSTSGGKLTEPSCYEAKRVGETSLKLRKLSKSCYFEGNQESPEEPFSGSESDEYVPPQIRNSDTSDCSSESEDPRDELNNLEQISPKKGKKRRRMPETWKKNRAKVLKNLGKSYITTKAKIVPEKTLKPGCPDRCRLACKQNIPENVRIDIFREYWALGSLQRQRDFLATCIEPLELKYRRIYATEKPRNQNCAFFFVIKHEKKRVCKTFLINTLGIHERTLRTVIRSKATGVGMAPEDKRGKHRKHVKIEQETEDSIVNHIQVIPRIESHYLRAHTSREFVDGGLSIAELYRNYKSERISENKPVPSYDVYAKIFNTRFNISFFVPKKDQCDVCESFKNALETEKETLRSSYDLHQEEKRLSRIEKDKDKMEASSEGSNLILAIYDLQAVMPVPCGQSSAFYYKSRLNCFNFTITDLGNKDTYCYFWHEGLGHRGANEIGSCVLKFIEELSHRHPSSDLVFYSDNCGGQQKNRFFIALYVYAVEKFDIKSITHKYLIRGHTQSEGDTVHSVIERAIKKAKKSGPIYVPDQYVSLIRNSKKTGTPYKVNELSYQDFLDLKNLSDDLNINCVKDIAGKQIKISEIKLLRFLKGSSTYGYKTSYKEGSWNEVQLKPTETRRSQTMSISEVALKPAYSSRLQISDNKKRDLLTLVNSNIIPLFYSPFFKNL